MLHIFDHIHIFSQGLVCTSSGTKIRLIMQLLLFQYFPDYSRKNQVYLYSIFKSLNFIKKYEFQLTFILKNEFII